MMPVYNQKVILDTSTWVVFEKSWSNSLELNDQQISNTTVRISPFIIVVCSWFFNGCIIDDLKA